VSWNTRELLKKCIESVLRYSSGVDYEIIAVDNASPDGTAEMLDSYRHSEAKPKNLVKNAQASPTGSFASAQDDGRIKIIRNSENKGFAKANNQGIREAKGKYLLLLNPDTELTENSLKKVFDKMSAPGGSAKGGEREASIGVLGCMLRNSDGSIQPSVRRFPRLRDIRVIFFKLYTLFPSLLDRYLAKDFDYSCEQEVDQVMGAFFCIRREVIEKIGLLDEGYFIWFEEVDFCRRAKKAGWKVVYWPDTSIIHHGGQSFVQVETLKKQWWFFKSAIRYFMKTLNYKN